MKLVVDEKIPEPVQRIIRKEKAYIVPADVSKILNISGDTVRAQARAGMLDFPVMVSDTRVRILKIPFLRWLGYDVNFTNGGEKDVSDSGL